MIKLIVGTKGSGKTKAMIDQIKFVVEKGMKLTYESRPAPAARLIDLDEYKMIGGEIAVRLCLIIWMSITTISTCTSAASCSAGSR